MPIFRVTCSGYPGEVFVEALNAVSVRAYLQVLHLYGLQVAEVSLDDCPPQQVKHQFNSVVGIANFHRAVWTMATQEESPKMNLYRIASVRPSMAVVYAWAAAEAEVLLALPSYIVDIRDRVTVVRMPCDTRLSHSPFPNFSVGADQAPSILEFQEAVLTIIGEMRLWAITVRGAKQQTLAATGPIELVRQALESAGSTAHDVVELAQPVGITKEELQAQIGVTAVELSPRVWVLPVSQRGFTDALHKAVKDAEQAPLLKGWQLKIEPKTTAPTQLIYVNAGSEEEISELIGRVSESIKGYVVWDVSPSMENFHAPDAKLPQDTDQLFEIIKRKLYEPGPPALQSLPVDVAQPDPEPETLYVLLEGNLYDGYKAVGPYSAEQVDRVTAGMDKSDYTILNLHPPK